jgi:RNA polymerase sigma-70 factor (ECF subfamily)
MNSKEQLECLKQGDIKAYEQLFRSMYPALCGYAHKILKDSDLAEEMVQDVFYILWKRKEQLNIIGSLNSYLYKAVYNKCLHYFEHKQVVVKHAQKYQVADISTYSADEAMYTGELYTVYKETLKQLPIRCRQIFQMNRKYGFKYQEIADKLSISVKTVEANMGKALKAFRQSFSAYNASE